MKNDPSYWSDEEIERNYDLFMKESRGPDDKITTLDPSFKITSSGKEFTISQGDYVSVVKENGEIEDNCIFLGFVRVLQKLEGVGEGGVIVFKELKDGSIFNQTLPPEKIIIKNK